MKFSHDLIEKNSALLILLVILTVSVGGLVEIVPLYFQRSTTEPVQGLQPYKPIELVGRNIYIREGCYNCHSQMIRPFRAETERYGHYSVAGEFVYDRPFQWGSKRTGPDLARVGGRYSDEWHRLHLNNPRDLVPESNMPAYPWLAKTPVAGREDHGYQHRARGRHSGELRHLRGHRAVGMERFESGKIRGSSAAAAGGRQR
jgi:cytochrome c oxidase cbb3-type subunit 2